MTSDLRPAAPALTEADAISWLSAGWAGGGMRAALVAGWVVVLVVGLNSDDSIQGGGGAFAALVFAAFVATLVLLIWDPVVGCVVGAVVGAAQFALDDSLVSHVVFGVYGLCCLLAAVRLRRIGRRQVAVAEAFASPVRLDLPEDTPVQLYAWGTRVVVGGLLLVSGTGLLVWFAFSRNEVLLAAVFGCALFGGYLLAREWNARAARLRLITAPAPAIEVLVSAEFSGRALLRVVDGGPDVIGAISVFDVADYAETGPFGQYRDDVEYPPQVATVLGDLREGGWVAVVTDSAVLLPNGRLKLAGGHS